MESSGRGHVPHVEPQHLRESKAGAQGHRVEEMVTGPVLDGREPEEGRPLGGRHRLGDAESGKPGRTPRAWVGREGKALGYMLQPCRPRIDPPVAVYTFWHREDWLRRTAHCMEG